MNRTIKSLSILIIAILVLILTSCSDSNSSDAKSSPGTLTTVKATTSTTEAPKATAAPTTTTTTLPLIIQAPTWQKFCSETGKYCVEVPNDGETLSSEPFMPKGKQGVTIDSFMHDMNIKLSSGQVCTVTFNPPPECDGFDNMSYMVYVEPMPGKTADQALSVVEKERYNYYAFHNVHRGTFAGSPAVLSEFHTRNGGVGPYISFFHNGLLYEISTNGQVGPSYGVEQFLSSFRFTS